MRAARRLLSTRRRVPRDRVDEYDRAWQALNRAATARGAHAWRFASATHESLFLEFLEFAPEADPRTDPDCAAAIERLDQSFSVPAARPFPAPERAEEWIELR